MISFCIGAGAGERTSAPSSATDVSDQHGTTSECVPWVLCTETD